ncbi:MAG: hypothetical protein H7099_16945 [Gemmatimonadaceae bacterium]|nr:hypothetical protein [Gemmatimonadaceae bacterium]
MRTGRWLVLGLSVLCTSCATGTLFTARTSGTHAADSVALPVPYVAQSELLCGGAAIAMIERWWGRRGVYAEQFAYLVDRAQGGIRTTDLAHVMRERGWGVQAGRTSAALVERSVSDSVPVVALIRVGENRYHYVVVVEWSATRVIYHDPAASPSVEVTLAEFMRRWAGANEWAMLVRPTTVPSTAGTPTATRRPALPIDSLPCRPWLDQAVDAASLDRLDEADRLLATAVLQCANEPLVLREQAGVRFRQKRIADALRLATEYSARVPSDSLGWQLLASSRFLAGDAVGALRAWNVIGRPVVDLLRIDGPKRIRYTALSKGMTVKVGSVLSPTTFSLAKRRLADFPSLVTTRVAYTPVAGGAVEVQATAVERPVLEPPRRLLIGAAVTALFRREVWLAVHSPLRLGDVWTGQWRWQSADPRVAVRVDIPTRIGVPGTVMLERSWEAYRFSAGLPVERRSVSTIGLSAWARPDLEQRAGVRFERWSTTGDFLTLTAGGAVHKADDRVSLRVSVEHAIPLTGNTAFSRASVRGAWALPVDHWSNTWSMRVGADAIGAAAPRGLWPLAGGGLARDIPLRAHPRIIDNRLPSELAGRRIIHGGFAGDRPVSTRRGVTLGVGAFLDGASVMASGNGLDAARLYLDAGAGVRLGTTSARFPSVRVDLARGLVTDRRWGLSAAFLRPLPVRLSTLR